MPHALLFKDDLARIARRIRQPDVVPNAAVILLRHALWDGTPQEKLAANEAAAKLGRAGAPLVADLVASFDRDEHVPCSALAFQNFRSRRHRQGSGRPDRAHWQRTTGKAGPAWRTLSDVVNAALTHDVQTVAPLVAALEAAPEQSPHRPVEPCRGAH